MRVYEKFSGKESLMEEDEFKQYLQRPAWIVNGKVITSEKQATELIIQLQQKREEQVYKAKEILGQKMLKEGFGPDAEVPEPDIPQVRVEKVDFQYLAMKSK